MIMLVEKNIISNLINNTVSWNNSYQICEGSQRKILQLTERHVVPQNYGSYKITPRDCM